VLSRISRPSRLSHTAGPAWRSAGQGVGSGARWVEPSTDGENHDGLPITGGMARRGVRLDGEAAAGRLAGAERPGDAQLTKPSTGRIDTSYFGASRLTSFD
jgi:hypothetical protein